MTASQGDSQIEEAAGGGGVDEATPLVNKKPRRRANNSNNKNSPSTKWLLLTLCCTIMGVMYYILAMPAALHRQLSAVMPAPGANASSSFEMNFNLLFTVSYVPNMVLPFFGGAVVDRCGAARCLVAFAGLVLAGQCLATAGAHRASWNWMLAGRLVFGLGAQNLIVANASLISRWFAGREGAALGLSNVCSYAGVIATNLLSPKLSNSALFARGPTAAFALGAVLQVGAVALGCGVVLVDRQYREPPAVRGLDRTTVCSPMYSPMAIRHSSHLQRDASAFLRHSVPSPGVTFAKKKEYLKQQTATRKSNNNGNSKPSGLAKLRGFKPTFWLLCLSFLLVYGIVWSFTNVSSGVLLERDFFLRPPADCLPKYPDECTSGSLAPKEGNPSVDSNGQACPADSAAGYAPTIPRSLHVTASDGTNYSFDSLAASDIQCTDAFWARECVENFCQDQAAATEKAGFFMSIPYFFTVALTFHLGLLVDSTGYRTELICLGSALLVVAHVLLAYPASSLPAVPLVAQGLGYTICVAALWPSVPFTVSEDAVGTAFGIMMSVQNVGLALIPLIVARLYNWSGDRYLPAVELFFAACSVLAVLAAVALLVSDRKTDHILATPVPRMRFSEEEGAFVVRHTRSHSETMLYGPSGAVVFA